MELDKNISDKEILDFEQELRKKASEHNLSFGFNRDQVDNRYFDGKVASNQFDLFVKDIEGLSIFDTFHFKRFSNEETFAMNMKIQNMINKMIELKKNKPIG